MLRAYYSDHFVLPLPDGHKFPMAKYSRLRERILAEGIIEPDQLHEAPAADWDDLRLVHDPGYVDAVANGTVPPDIQRRIGFPWSPQMVERARRSVGATIAAARAALDDGMAANLAGGTHHAFADRGEGFCVFNDVAVAARVLQRDHHARRIAIVDLDVHQGNGTAAIFEGDDTVRTFSMHGERNYPARKMRSTIDVGLPDGTDDEAYLGALEAHLPGLTQGFAPDLVFYLAGVDVVAGDRYGRFALTDEGLRARERCVLAWARAAGLPLVITLAGGYAATAERTAALHTVVFEEALS